MKIPAENIQAHHIIYVTAGKSHEPSEFRVVTVQKSSTGVTLQLRSVPDSPSNPTHEHFIAKTRKVEVRASANCRKR